MNLSIAYSELGGHTKINKPEDIFSSDWNFWEGIDIDNDEDFDIILFGKETKYGIKFSGVGHDGTMAAKQIFLDEQSKDLKKLGYYAEISGKLVDVLIRKYHCPVVDNQEEVEKVLSKKVEWIGNKEGSYGDSWYRRNISGKPYDKILVGRPNV